MEACQRRYTRNLSSQVQISPREPLTKEQIRKALIERRTIIGPKGEKFEIPKHMSLEDMVSYFKSEYGLTHAEVTQVLAAAEMLTLRPDYRGKLNRVVIDGAENPLRIEIPGQRPTSVKKSQIVQEVVKTIIPQNEVTNKIDTPKIETTRISSSIPRIEERPTLEIFVKNPSRDLVFPNVRNNDKVIPFDASRRQAIASRNNSYTVRNSELERKNEIYVNGIVADRMRDGRAQERRLNTQRTEQSKNLEKQMRAHYQEQVREANRKRKNRAAVVCVVAFLCVTGLVIDIVEAVHGTRNVGNSVEPIGIHENVGDLFEVTPQTIANFTGDINLIPTSQRTNEQVATTLGEYQNKESYIDIASQGLNANSNLANVLNKYSQNSTNPIVVGEITSYQEFEQILQNGDEALYTSGPAYFEEFSRQMLHGMLKDKYGAEKVKATYQKTGENNQNYEFYIRYFKNGSSTERTPEGRVTMSRNEEGRLQTNEYHTLPYEVYEILAMIGEFSDFTKNENGLPFDIEGYAAKFTNGDIQKARQELKERMTYGIEAMQTLLKDRVRADKVEYYRYER